MCGIAGYIYKSKKKIAENEKIKIMTDTLKHRGPDAEGQWLYENIALGHRRLAIIDLDEKSNQPMLSHDGKFIISFNGEIYNYIEIKNELKKIGSRFNTNSDTEVIMEAFRVYNTDCFNMFNGMWAFCLYDIDNEKLFFCRDRFGIKPLYILDREDVFAFASESKAIISAFPEENIADINSIYRYLSYTINENVDDRSYYKNIKIFPPGNYMEYDLKNNKWKFSLYWEYDQELFKRKWIDGKNPITTFKKLFESAIDLRLRADVEVGSCLSGGLDSSAIVGCASRKNKKRIHTFSSIYADEECNEEEFVRAVNEKWKTIPHYIKPDDYENKFTEYIKKIIYYHDGPASGASLYSQYMVMKGVHEHVKVVLDGQGADELFAGYIRYCRYYIEDLLDEDSVYNRLKAIAMLSFINIEWPEMIGLISTDTIVNLVGVKNSVLFESEKIDKRVEKGRSQKIFTEEFLYQVDDNYKEFDYKCSSRLNSRLCTDLLNKSIPALLHNEDSNSMAFSVESRVPFLDYRIVEFAIALDSKYKIRNTWTKWIIRKSCKKYLPKKVRIRKNKMGFPAPFSRWLREGKNKEEIKQIIFSFGTRNIVPMETIENYYNEHILGISDFSAILFRYYNMELWLRTCNA